MTLQVGQAQKAPKGTSDSEFVYLLSPYTGFLIMPTLFGVIADYMSISLLPVYLLVLLAAMFATHEFVVKKSDQ